MLSLYWYMGLFCPPAAHCTSGKFCRVFLGLIIKVFLDWMSAIENISHIANLVSPASLLRLQFFHSTVYIIRLCYFIIQISDEVLNNMGIINSPPATPLVTGSQKDTDQLFTALFTEVQPRLHLVMGHVHTKCESWNVGTENLPFTMDLGNVSG